MSQLWRWSPIFALLLVGALPVAAQAVDIHFDNLASGTTLTNQYHGLGFQPFTWNSNYHSSPNAGDRAYVSSAQASAACISVPWSAPNFMIGAVNNPVVGIGWRFTQGRVTSSLGFSLLQAGNAAVSVTFYDHTGQVLRSTTYSAPGGSGQCRTRRIEINQPNVASIRMAKVAPGTTDGYGVDNVTYSPLTLPAPPESPVISVITACPSRTAPANTVSWQAVNNATEYLVYRGNTFIGSTSSTSLTDTDLEPLEQVNYRVRASNSVGVSGFSNRVTITSHDCFDLTMSGPSILNRGQTGSFRALINGQFSPTP